MKTKSLWKEFTYIKAVLGVHILRTCLSDYLNFLVQIQIDSFIVKFLIAFSNKKFLTSYNVHRNSIYVVFLGDLVPLFCF